MIGRKHKAGEQNMRLIEVLKRFVELIIRDMIYMIIMAFNSKEHN